MPAVIELFAGAGGMAQGLNNAGYSHEALIEWNRDAAETLRLNHPRWNVVGSNIHELDPRDFGHADLIAAGLPSRSAFPKEAGVQPRLEDFPELAQALHFVEVIQPSAVFFENVGAFAAPRFKTWRESLSAKLSEYGYDSTWKLMQSYEYGVPQLRPRFVLVAIRIDKYNRFSWPLPTLERNTVGGALRDLMAERGWKGADRWARLADDIGPTIVGGSVSRGGADLGPTRTRDAWLRLGIDGRSIAAMAPGADEPFNMQPKLTTRMVARLQGFDDGWQFSGSKTSVYRQIASALPPAVARAVAESIRDALIR